MGELKSAWEIAAERAKRLGRLSEEEKEQQERERCVELGRGLAQKWLDSPEAVDLASELEKYSGKEGAMIKEAVLQRLASEIELSSAVALSRSERIATTLGQLEPRLRSKLEEIAALFQEYRRAEEKMSGEIEEKRWQVLHQLRISGTAVAGVNVAADPQWRQGREKLEEEFQPQLHRLKQELLAILSGER